MQLARQNQLITVSLLVLLLLGTAVRVAGQGYPPLTETEEKAVREMTTLLAQANKAQEEGDYDTATSIVERALANIEKTIGPEHIGVTFALNNLAELHRQKGDYERAEQLHLRALRIREKILGPEHTDVAVTLSNLALLLDEKGNEQRAETFALRALAIREKVLGPEHPLVALSLNNLAEIYKEKADFSRAESHMLRAMEIREKALGPEHPDVTMSLNNLAGLYFAKGEYERMEPLYQRALRINEKVYGPNNVSVAITLNNIAELERELGLYAQAEPHYQRAISIFEKTLGPDAPAVATAVNNLALLYNAKGDYARAESLFNRAIGISEKAFGQDAPSSALFVSNLAAVLQVTGNYDGAAQGYQRSLAITEKALGPDHPNVALILNSLGTLYLMKRDFQRAILTFERVIGIYEKALSVEHPGIARTLNNLAWAYAVKQDYSRAEGLYLRALRLIEKVYGPNHPDAALPLQNLALIYGAQGDTERAISAMARCNEVRERNLALVLATGSEDQKLLYMSTLSVETDATVTFHVRLAPNRENAARLALTTILRRKGRVLDALSDQLGLLRRRSEPRDQKVIDQLSAARSQLAKLVLRGPRNEDLAKYQKDKNTIEIELQRLEAEVSSRSAEFQAQSQPITLERIQAAIPVGAALVEIVSFEPLDYKSLTSDDSEPERYVAYVLKRESAPQWVDLGEAADINQAVSELRNALRDAKRSDVKRLARVLDEKVMQPVRRLMGDTRWALLSPDGALNLIPFAALVDEQNNYLIENYLFTYLTSGSDLLRLQKSGKNGTGPIVFANPLYDRQENPRGAQLPEKASGRGTFDFSNVKFLPLSGTAEEAKALSTIIPDVKIVVGAQATEESLKKVSGPSILHVATHGFFLPDEKEKPGQKQGSRQLQFTIGDSTKAAPRIDNPLLRSGLALAGANQRQGGADEDGILTALEVAGLDLAGTELVVLSACETGLGDVRNGDGVYGLRRTLVIAGAKSQVMSLWQVSDAATRDLMVEYYKRLQAREGAGEALRKVQLEMLQSSERSHPFYWASFIQSGDWRSLNAR